MPVQPRDECPHFYARSLGMLVKVPAVWLAGTDLPNHGADLESAWCRGCQRYLWRELGCPDWMAFDLPA